MGIFTKLIERFRRKSAAIFVDFEHWCYSLENLFSMHPDVASFFENVSKEYKIKRIYFFGDFTSPALRYEVNRIREYTNNIIDTQNPSNRSKKDHTDFIMLDYIYRDVEEKDKVGTYIIFSGDGHFTSVAAYLKNKKKKRVVIYGVENATSNRLRSVADECVLLPTQEQEEKYRKRLVLLSIHRNISKYGDKHFTTFQKTVDAVSQYNNIDKDLIKKVMNDMIQDGILVKGEVNLGKMRKLRTIEVNWQAAIEYGLWEFEKAV